MVLNVRKYLIAGFVFSATAPLAVFLLWPHSGSYDRKVAEVRERHLLIAENLGAAMETYHRDLVAVMDGFAGEIAEHRGEHARGLFKNLYFRHLCVADIATGVVEFSYLTEQYSCPEVIPPARMEMFRTLARQDVGLSPVVAPDGERPRIFLVKRVGEKLVVGAVHTDFFGNLQKRISFGRQGHAAILDGAGHVLAHPLPEWAETAKDLSGLAPVRRMMAGEKGVETFWSPALKADMIAGFTSVPGAGWGVMVPQPVAELQDAAKTYTRDALLILCSGLVLSLGIALAVSGQISQSLGETADRVRALAQGDNRLSGSPPRARARLSELVDLQQDIEKMARSISKAHADLADSNSELRLSNALLRNEINERVLAERRRSESEMRFRSFFENVPVAIREEDFSSIKRDIDALRIADHAVFRRYVDSHPEFLELCREKIVLVDANSAALKLHGYSDKESMRDQVTRRLSAESMKILRRTVLAIHKGETRLTYVIPIYPRQGEPRRVEATWVVMPGHEKTYSRILLTSFDITERERSEERLRKAQKMEAVGQLTGGMAHDFNNLLTVIGGNADLIEFEMQGSPFVEPIRQAVQRGAELTQRLLAFSRRQPLAPRDLDLQELIGDVAMMLERTLGEHIRIDISAQEGLWPVLADRNQLENAILNLGLNARDAMPNGGLIRIDCANVSHSVADARELALGDYVRLSFSDTGTGMPEDVLARVFEPFFTTKGVGKGSGLGLSMIYGFAKQSGGLAEITSVLGEGTRVDILLPRGLAELQPKSARPPAVAIPRGDQRQVLLLEDQSDVRRLMVRILDTLGYQVLPAADAMEAKAILAAEKGIRIALCDISLSGGTSGIEFAEEALATYPGLDVVFYSGNPPEVLGPPECRVAGCVVLAKPVDRETVGKTLHAVLSRQSAAPVPDMQPRMQNT